MKHALPAVLLLATLQARAADGAAGTVGAVVRNNGLEQDRYVYVPTPSLMHVAKAAAPTPQTRAATDNYDQAAQLSPDPLIRAESLRRPADLPLPLADAGEATAAELDQAVAGYQTLLADYPDYA